MKIVVIARAKNEENNVEKFIKSYDWADRVLIVDGGSDDNTVAIAKDCRADIFYFHKTVECNSVTRNPHGEHWNKAIEIAETVLKADWIIHDDVDCTPNLELKTARQLIESSERPFIYLTRVYLYQDRGYASGMSSRGGEWQQSLWAWQANRGFRFSEDDPFTHTFDEPKETDIWRIKPPFALLHRPWPTDEAIAEKLQFYDKIYDRKTAHPLSYCGEIKPLEWWMKNE